MRLSTEGVHYELSDLRAKQIPILQCIDQVCRQHNLRYYLWAGTLLGAVRHKGFIPWDDDMDISMPRPDYELLVQHAHEWLPAPFEVIGSHNRPDYPYPFIKVIDGSTTLIERPDFMFPEGVFLDIFPLDGYPASDKEGRRHLSNYHFWRHLLFLRGRDPFKHGHGPRSWWPQLLHKVFSLSWLQNKVQGLMKKYPFEESPRAIEIEYLTRGIVEKDWLGTGIPIQFEGETYNTVENPDACLHTFYGDYMTLPPKEKQVQHVYLHVDLNTPYRQYMEQNNISFPS